MCSLFHNLQSFMDFDDVWLLLHGVVLRWVVLWWWVVLCASCVVVCANCVVWYVARWTDRHRQHTPRPQDRPQHTEPYTSTTNNTTHPTPPPPKHNRKPFSFDPREISVTSVYGCVCFCQMFFCLCFSFGTDCNSILRVADGRRDLPV